ncbi:MAG: transcriptional coactivator p15/PC4 family protein [Thaumarchaeota archaeon]|nr:transcriptional coactivator p15/PC4 family protein [Nitrososphaerota archaeon]
MSEEEAKTEGTTEFKSTLIGEVKLTESSTVRVSTFDGRDGRKRVDIRLFLSGPKYTGPTKRGVSIPVDQLAELEKLLASTH